MNNFFEGPRILEFLEILVMHSKGENEFHFVTYCKDLKDKDSIY
jgi:hypothetical protein